MKSETGRNRRINRIALMLLPAFFAVLAGAFPGRAADNDKEPEKWYREKTLIIPAKVEGLRVDPAEELVVFTVVVRNAGATTISDYKVTAGCSCFLHADGTGPIAPGESREITLWFDTALLTRGKTKGTRSIYWTRQSGPFTLRYGKTKLYWSSAR